MDIRRFLSKRPRVENDVHEYSQETLNTQPSTAVETACEINISSYDIGSFAQKPSADGIGSIARLQTKIWAPPEGYNFPASGSRNLKFQRSWLQKYLLLAYSAKEDGAFCKCCVLFGVRQGGVGHQTLGQLATNPFTNWKKALENIEKHHLMEYHKTSLLQWTLRARIEENKFLPVNLQVSKQKLDFLNESKLRLIPVIETIIFCGRQGLALRGSKVAGRISEDEPSLNDGNFRALLRLRAKNDRHLKEQLKNSPKNAVYISNRTQNELIAICDNLVVNHNIDRINKSRGFSFLGDDTPDIGGIEQASICIRYLDERDGKFIIREDFLCFLAISDFTGKGIATAFLDFLKSSGLDCTYFFGQGYDGAKSVSGEFHGAQAYIRKIYPLALYSHCAAHSFNLVVSSACNITVIKNSLGTLQSAHSFFIYPKCNLALQDAINEDENLKEDRMKKLKKFCTTRWVEQHESVRTYLHLQPAVIRTLELISTTWKDSTTSSGAFQLLSAIKTPNFQICMFTLSSVHSLTLSLSRMIQAKNQDLGEVIELADSAKEEFMERRENAVENFRKIFETVSTISEEYDIVLRKPRLSSKQTQRLNVQTDSVEDYYRITIYIPYLDTFIAHLQDRFLKHRNILSNFACLFPNKMETFNEKSCVQLFGPYSSILRDDSHDIWISEVQLWRRRIAGKDISNALEALDICSVDAFPNVHQILRLMAILPVTTATNERSFSTLRRLKTYLRSTMTEDRLNGLASLNIHRDVEIDVQKVSNEFFSVPRRINLLTNGH